MPGIVIGYDGTDPSRRALERVSKIAGDSRVTVVSVAPAGELRQGQRSREARDLLRERGIAATVVDGVGDAATALVGEAIEQRADLLVVGSGGKGLLERLALGSVSDAVVRRAPCDVMVVR